MKKRSTRIAITLGKAAMAVFWASELLNLFQVLPRELSSLTHWIAIVLLAVHAIEVGLFTRLHAHQLVEPKLHKMQILIFGVFHWLDLLRRGDIHTRRPSTRY